MTQLALFSCTSSHPSDSSTILTNPSPIHSPTMRGLFIPTSLVLLARAVAIPTAYSVINVSPVTVAIPDAQIVSASVSTAIPTTQVVAVSVTRVFSLAVSTAIPTTQVVSSSVLTNDATTVLVTLTATPPTLTPTMTTIISTATPPTLTPTMTTITSKATPAATEPKHKRHTCDNVISWFKEICCLTHLKFAC